jgi:cytidine deaminase
MKNIQPSPADIPRLVDAARDGMRCAYGIDGPSPLYGAAVLTDDGNIYSGGQYKAGTRQISLHAEQVAFVHAAAHGENKYQAIAIVSDEDENKITNPCGVCKQAIYEAALFADQEIWIILASMSGTIAMHRMWELITFPWP